MFSTCNCMWYYCVVIYIRLKCQLSGDALHGSWSPLNITKPTRSLSCWSKTHIRYRYTTMNIQWWPYVIGALCASAGRWNTRTEAGVPWHAGRWNTRTEAGVPWHVLCDATLSPDRKEQMGLVSDVTCLISIELDTKSHVCFTLAPLNINKLCARHIINIQERWIVIGMGNNKIWRGTVADVRHN